MLKRVWFGSGSGAAAFDDDREYGWAPFTLRIEYVELSRIRLRIRATIKLRNSEMGRLIGRYKLGSHELYRDKEAARIAEQNGKELTEQEKGEAKGFWQRAWNCLATFEGPWLELGAWWQRKRVLRLTLNQLTRGVEVKGNYDELREFARALTRSADDLAGRISDASAFNLGRVDIWAPGQKPKKVKEKTKASLPSVRWV